MNEKHWIVSLTNSRAEMQTTDLGLAAFDGKRDEVKRALERGVDWSEEGEYLLSSAIFGLQWEIARDILRAGMPVSDSTYKEIYYWADHSLLEELPPHPELLSQLKVESQQWKFFSALVDGNFEEVKALFRHEWINIESEILGDRVPMSPLHYAARSCHAEMIEFLLDAGAEVNALTGNGESALTLVARWPGSDKSLRKKCFRLLRDRGGELIPPVRGWFENWRLSRGGWKS